MARGILSMLLVLPLFVSSLDAQTRPRSSAKRPVRQAARPAPMKPVREPPLMQCPSILGNGLTSQRLYCDVLAGSDATSALRITLPPHNGPLTLCFNLHNRQTYSDTEVKEGKAFARYTASLRVIKPTGEELDRVVVQSEFRTEADLVERIGGGAGPGGVKAVAPTGTQPVVLTLDEDSSEVWIVGERLLVERIGGTEAFTAPGRPIAVVSHVEIEYRPAKPATRRR